MGDEILGGDHSSTLEVRLHRQYWGQLVLLTLPTVAAGTAAQTTFETLRLLEIDLHLVL